MEPVLFKAGAGIFRYFFASLHFVSVFFALIHFVSHTKNPVSLEAKQSEKKLFFREIAKKISLPFRFRFASSENAGTP